MTTKGGLRTVKTGESAPKRLVQSVAQAASSGSYRDLLVAMRERIARTVSDPDCPAVALAALTRRLNDIAKEIELIDLRAKQEAVEDGDVAGDEAWDSSTI